jgi:hypothetical protein
MSTHVAHCYGVAAAPLLRALTVRTVGSAGVAAIVLVGVLGWLHVRDPAHFSAFDLDAERTVPAMFSAALLGAGAAVAIVLAYLDRRSRWLWCLFSAFLAIGSLDELLAFHERLQYKTGIDWGFFYLPVLLVAGWGFLVLLYRLRPRERRLLVLGTGAWGLSQVIEKIQWFGAFGTPNFPSTYARLMVTEELLEMAGSLLFLLACLTVVERVQDGWRGFGGGTAPAHE